MTDDVRKLRERLLAWNWCDGLSGIPLPPELRADCVAAASALAALEPADPSQPAAGIVAEIDAILRAPVLPPEQTTALAIEMVRSVLQRARDEIVRLYDRLELTWAWKELDGQMVKVWHEPWTIPDGIECRDETIKLQDKRIAALESQLAAQAKVIEAARACLPHWDDDDMDKLESAIRALDAKESVGTGSKLCAMDWPTGDYRK